MNKESQRSGKTRILPVLLAAMGCLTALGASYPAWWTTRSVVNTNAAATNDYAAVAAGQVKWIATNACDELQQNLPNGAGTGVLAMVGNFTASNNCCGVNVGQVKNVAKPIWDRLIQEGYTNKYPWGGTVKTNDFAMANIGQVKNVFSFDLTKDSDGDGLANWVETGTGIFVSPWNTGTSATTNDTDHDGILDNVEITNRTDPNNPDTTVPIVTITAPQNQTTRMVMP